jgi:hypothetical protein
MIEAARPVGDHAGENIEPAGRALSLNPMSCSLAARTM